MPAEPRALAFVRRCLLALLTLGTIGMSVELWLVGHFGNSNQLIPLAIAGMGLASIVAVAVRPRTLTLRALQFTMLCYAGAGVIGISLHYQANVATQHEADPALAGWELFWRVVQTAAPPALAPGILVQLALLGLLFTVRHPALGEQSWTDGDEQATSSAKDVEAMCGSHGGGSDRSG